MSSGGPLHVSGWQSRDLGSPDIKSKTFEIRKFTFLQNNMTFENSYYFKALLNNQKITIPYTNRNQLLLGLIDYYKLQHHELKNITSHLIIESLRT